MYKLLTFFICDEVKVFIIQIQWQSFKGNGAVYDYSALKTLFIIHLHTRIQALKTSSESLRRIGAGLSLASSNILLS